MGSINGENISSFHIEINFVRHHIIRQIYDCKQHQLLNPDMTNVSYRQRKIGALYIYIDNKILKSSVFALKMNNSSFLQSGEVEIKIEL